MGESRKRRKMKMKIRMKRISRKLRKRIIYIRKKRRRKRLLSTNLNSSSMKSNKRCNRRFIKRVQLKPNLEVPKNKTWSSLTNTDKKTVLTNNKCNQLI
jgi:hypothetical protein